MILLKVFRSKFVSHYGHYYTQKLCHSSLGACVYIYIALWPSVSLYHSSQAPVGVTTSHQCYGSCTVCQSVSVLCSRSWGLYISRSLERLPRTSQTTVAFCRTMVVAHCGPIPMTRRSCSCREHITNSMIGVSRPPERPST